MKRGAIGLQVSLDVEGRLALVIGGGAEAEDKVARLREGGARVRVMAADVTAMLGEAAAAGAIEWIARPGDPSDCADADLVLVCERDPHMARAVYEAAAALGVLVWCCDAPEFSDLAMPALARLGRARVAISTGGAAPALASAIRVAIERDLGERFPAFVARLGAERERLLRDEPDPERRRERLRALLDGFALTVSAAYPPQDGP